MSGAANTYDTTNLDSNQWAQMATLIGNDMRSGQTFNVTGPFASQMVNAASAQSGVMDAATGTSPIINIPIYGQNAPASTGASATGAAGSDNWAGFYGGQENQSTEYNPITGKTGGSPSDVGPNAQGPSTVINWVQSHMANYGLVILGALLVLGALLISQRKNAETVITTVGKVAAVAG